MLVGGFVAILVQALFFPVTSRSKLVESLGQAVLNINEMESSIAIGLETEDIDISNMKLAKHFHSSRKRANLYLAAATDYCVFSGHPSVHVLVADMSRCYDRTGT